MPEQVFHISDQTKEIVITNRKGLDEESPYPFHQAGRVDSVSRFIEGRPEEVSGKQAPNIKSIVEVYPEKGSITLIIDPNDRYGNKITGSLDPAPDLDQFKINTNKKYDRNDLLKLIRFNSYRIDNAKRLVEELQKLNISASIQSKNQKDQRGNVDKLFSKNVFSEIPESFVISLPIFKSMPAEKFRVDIVMETTDASVEFWLESVELHQLIETRRAEILEEEVKKIESSGLLVIYKN